MSHAEMFRRLFQNQASTYSSLSADFFFFFDDSNAGTAMCHKTNPVFNSEDCEIRWLNTIISMVVLYELNWLGSDLLTYCFVKTSENLKNEADHESCIYM